eukprot:gb/GEZJ01005755.1/.p1 GENE.gb/GEZJ01005755.1/~~gb/GEZJ01005755.1/.p1  ORF type:complete len:279 (-),score=33.01 gb/GEZJ01005755.1/:824-1660(-)
MLQMHLMDLITRYSSALVVTSTSLTEAIFAFEASWLSQFWYPDSIRADKAFQVGSFKRYAKKLGIPIHRVPPGRHSKNAIVSKHNIFRSIFINLKEDAGSEFDPKVAAYKPLCISNDLYGNNTLSAFELAKGFSNPIAAEPNKTAIPDDVRIARDQLQERRKLALILRSNSVTEPPIAVGDFVEVNQKKDYEKRGKWTDPKPILLVNRAARSVTVPGRKGREIIAAFEDTWPALSKESFAQLVQEGMGSVDELSIEQRSSAGTLPVTTAEASPDYSTK